MARKSRGGSWGWGGGGYDYYEPSVPRPVKDGIKVKSERGTIGESWWSKRWVGVLESFGLGTRLTRGRSYARQGQVISIEVAPGEVKAKVQGSRPQPYKVVIGLAPLSERAWEKVTEAMAEQALFAAKLLAGEMPQNIEEAFQVAGVHLFPTASQELETDCSCPDYANPCKHIAAVYYILAERFDEDPFLIFKLRGRTKEAIIASLREKRLAVPAEAEEISGSSSRPNLVGPASSVSVPPLEECLEHFWQVGPELADFRVNLTPPAVSGAILKRLGEMPFKVGRQNLSALLLQAYKAAEKIKWPEG